MTCKILKKNTQNKQTKDKKILDAQVQMKIGHSKLSDFVYQQKCCFTHSVGGIQI